MSESALEAPRLGGSPVAGDTLARRPGPTTLSAFTRRHVWWLVTAALLAVSIAVVAWTPTLPSFDAFGWLTWGYQTLHGKLDLGGAPSWKPLPYVFTVPYALFGSTELWLWMVTCVAVSLGGAVCAGRIAYRLTLWGSGEGEVMGTARLRPDGVSSRLHMGALAAGVFAGVALLGIEDYTHYILSVQSDPMIVAFTLGAIDAHLSGRRRWALAFWVLASLGRPEAWPWLFLYSGWAWLRVPRMRWMIVTGWIAVLFLWFAVPWITNGRPFVSAQLAMNSPRELHSNKVFGTISRFHELLYLPVWIAAAIAVVWAAARRNLIVLGLAVIAVGWLVVEIAFALHGWPALPRYMFEAAGVSVVLAGVAVGWVLNEGPRLRPGLPTWIGVPALVILVLALVPGAVTRLRHERTDLRHEQHRATQITLMGNAIDALGGWRHVRHCAKPTAWVEWVSALAWYTRADVGLTGHNPVFELAHHAPVLIFSPLSTGGWQIVPYHLHHRNYAVCSQLRSYYVYEPGHPNGVLKRY